MATAFAVTGIQRARLKNYRPSYHCELEPIYEDPAAFRKQQERRNSNIAIVKNCVQNSGIVHNYEEIDHARVSDVRLSHPNSRQSRTSTAMLNGMIMNLKTQRHRPVRTYTDPYPVHDDDDDEKVSYPASESAIVVNELKCEPVKNEQLKSSLPVEKNNNLVNGLVKLLQQSNSEPSVRTNENSVQDKPNELPVLDLELVGNAMPSLSRQSSLYKADDTGGSTLDGVVTGSNGHAGKQWPKLEVKAPSKKPLLCPAEKKVKKRCFVLCVLIIVTLVGVLILGIIEGWMYTRTGSGFGGTDEPIFTVRASPPVFNTTDSTL